MVLPDVLFFSKYLVYEPCNITSHRCTYLKIIEIIERTIHWSWMYCNCPYISYPQYSGLRASLVEHQPLNAENDD